MPHALPIDRPVVFPLFGVRDGRCSCGNPDCSAAGKHPRVPYRELRYGDPVPLPGAGAGAGLKTGAAPYGSDVFVVDLDGPQAALAFDAMGETPETYTVMTPRAEGGWHLYFKHPGFHVKTSAGDLAPNIDIRGDGGIVIAPGSPHKNGGVYDGTDTTRIADAPPWLLDWLRQQKAPTEAQFFPGDVDGEEKARRRALYSEWLRTDAPARGPALRGQGDAILFKVVQRGAYDLALPVADVLELVREHYDPRCDPPWGNELEERVRHKARDAKENSTRPRAAPLPADLAHLTQSNKPETISESITTLGERWGGWDSIPLPPIYLLDGLIPEGKVVTFFAEGGSVKTWSALALAVCVAAGTPWLGKYPVKKGKVLYLDYEDGPHEVQRRVRLLTGGIDIPDLGYLYGGPQIDRDELWKTLARMVLEHAIILVVVDSLGAGMPGDADENTTAFAAGMKIAGRFTETGCTVLFVHHANKTGGMRGTSAARDQSDVVFKFEPVSETDSIKRMRMICDKPGPQKRPAPVNVELSDAGLTTFEDEALTTGRNAKTSQEIQSAIRLALIRPLPTMDAIRTAVGGTGTKVDKEVRALEALGEIKYLERIGYALDDDKARAERVLDQVRGFAGWKSKAELAKAAYVTTRFVEGMVRERAIQPRVVGSDKSGFMIVDGG